MNKQLNTLTNQVIKLTLTLVKLPWVWGGRVGVSANILFPGPVTVGSSPGCRGESGHSPSLFLTGWFLISRGRGGRGGGRRWRISSFPLLLPQK